MGARLSLPFQPPAWLELSKTLARQRMFAMGRHDAASAIFQLECCAICKGREANVTRLNLLYGVRNARKRFVCPTRYAVGHTRLSGFSQRGEVCDISTLAD